MERERDTYRRWREVAEIRLCVCEIETEKACEREIDRHFKREQNKKESNKI